MPSIGNRSRDAAEIGSSETSAQSATFVLNGEYWMVGYRGSHFSLRNSLGLGYIYRLLQSPGVELHALDLETGFIPGATAAVGDSDQVSFSNREGFSLPHPGDAGPVLDQRAKQEFRRRLMELKEELDECHEKDDYERGEKVESEIEAITRYLSQAVGLGGRDRRAGSTAERARLNVSRAIRAAIQRIAEHHASLGEFLGSRVKTGSFCCYLPNPRVPINWKLTADAMDISAAALAYRAPFSTEETSNIQLGTYRTAFVGRDEERFTLRNCLQLAKNGEGGIVVVSGPPGIGKTRTSREIGEEARRQGFTALAGNCYDREDSVPFVPFVELLEVILAVGQSPVAIKEIFGSQAAELTRVLPKLSRLLPDLPPPQQVSPEQSRRLLFSAVVELIARHSALRPIVLLLEDLHWADEGTLALLVYLGRSISKMPVMIIATHRDDEIDMKPLLTQALEELTRVRVLQRVQLRGLPQPAVARMIEGLIGQEPSPALIDLIYSNSEGNPLFVEELIGHLEQRRSKVDFVRMLEQGEIALPHSLRLVMGRRLGLVSNETMRILGTAAVIGRSFPFRLLEAATKADPDGLVDSVEEAERAGLISSKLEYPEARFKFAHELIRRAVLDGVSIARRQRLHLNIADAIELLYPNSSDEHVEDLAHHYWNAGSASDPIKPIRYLQMAGERAARNSSNIQAANDFRKALDLLQALPDTPDRMKQESLLYTMLGTALIATKGFSSQEVQEAYAHARELSERVGESHQFFRVLFGLWLSYASRGQYETALEVGRRCLRLAESEGDAGLLLEANHAIGVALICIGELEDALQYLDRAVAIYDAQKHADHAEMYGHDPAVVCLMHAGWALWLLGYPEQAVDRSNQSLALAHKLGHPQTVATAEAFVACLQQWCGNVPAVEELSASATAISAERDFAYYRAMAIILGGWAIVQRGQPTKGVEQMRQGLEAFLAMGAVLLSSYFSGLLAEAYALQGHVDQAFDILDRADYETEPWWKAELCRLKGELILRGDELGNKSGDCDEAEKYFRQAIEVARAQRAKSLELRAATSLSRVLVQQGKRSEARVALNEILANFTEGFDTQDLRQAKRMLEQV